jgi:hypothetical protein
MRIDIKQLEFIDLNLRTIVYELEDLIGIEFTTTSLFRIGDNGVHGALPLRGMDLRCKGYKFGKLLATFINDNWEYDPSRPDKKCCLFHNAGSGYHLHIQTHPNTKRKT